MTCRELLPGHVGKRVVAESPREAPAVVLLNELVVAVEGSECTFFSKGTDIGLAKEGLVGAPTAVNRQRRVVKVNRDHNSSRDKGQHLGQVSCPRFRRGG